jgi:hypothetical protein
MDMEKYKDTVELQILKVAASRFKNLKEFAEKFGYKESAIQNYHAGDRKIPAKLLLKIILKYNLFDNEKLGEFLNSIKK